MIKNIFILGAVTGTESAWIDHFLNLKEIILEFYPNLNVTTPLDIESFCDIQRKKGLEQGQILLKMANFDRECVLNADLIICDCTRASTGLGIELGMAYENGKRVVPFAHINAEVSGLVKGFFGEINRYNTLTDIAKSLDKYINVSKN